MQHLPLVGEAPPSTLSQPGVCVRVCARKGKKLYTAINAFKKNQAYFAKRLNGIANLTHYFDVFQ